MRAVLGKTGGMEGGGWWTRRVTLPFHFSSVKNGTENKEAEEETWGGGKRRTAATNNG